jgi:hypothetical protein
MGWRWLGLGETGQDTAEMNMAAVQQGHAEGRHDNPAQTVSRIHSLPGQVQLQSAPGRQLRARSPACCCSCPRVRVPVPQSTRVVRAHQPRTHGFNGFVRLHDHSARSSQLAAPTLFARANANQCVVPVHPSSARTQIRVIQQQSVCVFF